MARRARTLKFTETELLRMRWASQSEGEDWLRKHNVKLLDVGMIFGMADDTGVSLQKSDYHTRPAGPIGGTSSSFLDRPFSQLMREELWPSSEGGDCYIVIPGPFRSTDILKRLPFYVRTLHMGMKVVASDHHAKPGEVLAHFKAEGPLPWGTARTPPLRGRQSGPQPAAPEASEDTALAEPAAEPAAEPVEPAAEPAASVSRRPAKDTSNATTSSKANGSASSGGSRTISYDQMLALAARKGGVSGAELTQLNGSPQPWKSYLVRAARAKGSDVLSEKDGTGQLVYKLTVPSTSAADDQRQSRRGGSR